MSGRYPPHGSSSSRRTSRDYGRSSRGYDRGNDRGNDRGYNRGFDDPYDDDAEDDYRPHRSARSGGSSRGSSSRDSSNRGSRGYARDDDGGVAYAPSRRPGRPDAPVWGQAAAPTYPGYGQGHGVGYGGRGAVMAPPRPRRKSRRGLWITLGVIAVLLLVLGGGVVFAAAQFFAPAVAAGEFCGFVKAQGYPAAYGLLSADLKSTVSEAQFGAALTALDTLDGAVSACAAASGSNSYSASLFGSTATVGMVMTRATAGALQGSLRLKKESGGWHVEAIDGSLLGANLGALVAADSYCADLKAQQYADAYKLLGTKLQAASKQADFVQLQQWHDTVDGQVSVCQPTAIASGGTDSAQSFTLSLTRAKLGAQKGALALAVESGAWKIGSVDAPLQGSDLSALETGGRFCADLASANYADAYTLLDSYFTGGRTQAQTEALLQGTSASSGGVAWTSCTIDASTFEINGTRAAYNMTVTFTRKSTGDTAQLTKTFVLVQVSGAWKLHAYVANS